MYQRQYVLKTVKTIACQCKQNLKQAQQHPFKDSTITKETVSVKCSSFPPTSTKKESICIMVLSGVW